MSRFAQEDAPVSPAGLGIPPGKFVEPAAWQRVWDELGVAEAPRSVHAELIERYSEPHRAYHTLRHLAECLDLRQRFRAPSSIPAEVELVLWFHDAIYDPTRQDNEERSAKWLDEVAHDCRLGDATRRRLRDLVMVTRHDAAPMSLDQAVLVDTDLAILGAPLERFDEYDRQIRKEYRHVPAFLYRRKRRQVLQGFLGRDRIYSTTRYFEAFERQARENLVRAIDLLR
jgi:predicted metal-dependent HD superfamily phosphohydrolase